MHRRAPARGFGDRWQVDRAGGQVIVRVGRRVGWGIADQTASSLTNFALGIVVASQTTTASFGAFSLAFVTYLLVLNVGRAIVTLPLMIRYSGLDAGVPHDAVRAGSGTGLAVGVASGVVCVGVGIVVGGPFGAALFGLGIGLPGLILQDTWRFAFFAGGRDRSAFVNDIVWVAVLVPAFAVLIANGARDAMPFIVAWGGAASVAAGAGVVQSGVIPDPTRAMAWVRRHSDFIPQFTLETGARMGSSQLTYYVIGLVGGLVVVGAIRAGELVLGAFNVLFQGIHLIALPEGARLLRQSRGDLVRWAILLSAVLSAAAAAFGIACLLIPDWAGQAALGESWTPARMVLPVLVLSLVGYVVASGAGVGLRALGAANRLLRVSVLTSMVTLAAGFAGVQLGAAAGAAWGLAVGSWFGAVISWVEFRSASSNLVPEVVAEGR